MAVANTHRKPKGKERKRRPCAEMQGNGVFF